MVQTLQIIGMDFLLLVGVKIVTVQKQRFSQCKPNTDIYILKKM